MNKEVLSRKEKERLFKQAAIMDAAVSIFAKKGYRDQLLMRLQLLPSLARGQFIIISKVKKIYILRL